MSTSIAAPSSPQESAFVPFHGWQPWLVLLSLVASRLLLVLFAGSLSGDDGGRYLAEATNVWAHGTFSAESGAHPLPTAHDLPLFPTIMATFLAVCKVPLLAAKLTSLLNCLLFGVAARGVYDLAFRLTRSYITATLAMLIFGCFPESFPYSVFYMPESLFLAFLVWCLVRFVQFLHTRQLRPLLWSFLLWGLSTLAKPISLFAGPVLAVAAIAFVSFDSHDRARKVWSIIGGLLLGTSLLLPWVVRNYRAFGVIGISSITGSNLFYYNYLYMLEDMRVPDPEVLLASQEAYAAAGLSPSRDNPMVRAALIGAIAARQIRTNWRQYVITTLKRHPKLYAGTGAIATLRLFGDAEGVSAMEHVLAGGRLQPGIPLRALILQVGSWLLLGLAYASAFLGMLRLARHRNWDALGVILVAILYFAILIGPVTATRYRLVMLPALSVASAVGLGWRIGYRRDCGRPSPPA